MYDLLIIGGGINGAGIARDAAGRGLKVYLCEKDDLASHTSSASTKLIHGGLRYLEQYDFSLVRKALKEREVLLNLAPHIIWPMRFVLPHLKGLRPKWLIRLGLFFYDHMGGRKELPATSTVRRGTSGKLSPLKTDIDFAFEYSDCWVDDSRLVALNAVDAAEMGAVIETRSECKKLERHSDHWEADIQSGGVIKKIKAKQIVNAAGPWVDDLLNQALSSTIDKSKVRLVKGSHIITRPLFKGSHAYLFQNPDGRIVFAIPYLNNAFTLIGTTDIAFTGNRNNAEISEDEIQYLCDAASEYFEAPIEPNDVVSSYSGIRPLYDDQEADASAVTRDYVLSYDDTKAPILSVFGGKITTYRKLAEDALDILGQNIQDLKDEWTLSKALAGGNIPQSDFDGFLTEQKTTFAWLDEEVVSRMARTYGTRLSSILRNATSTKDLGTHYGHGLYGREVEYLVAHEFAQTSEDILFRRTKLGLFMTEGQIDRLQRDLEGRLAA